MIRSTLKHKESLIFEEKHKAFDPSIIGNQVTKVLMQND